MPTENFLRAVTASAADDDYIVLLRLSCPEFPDWSDLLRDDPSATPLPTDWPPHTLCLVANDENVRSNEITYQAFGFDFVRPPPTGGQASLRIDNVDRRVFDSIKLLGPTARISVACDIVLAGQADFIENSYAGLELRAVTANRLSINGELSVSVDDSEPFCSISYLPFNTPGIYG